MIKLLHVTPAFYPATYWGGPIFSVYGLCNALVKHTEEIQLRVITTDSAGPRRNQRVAFDTVPVQYDTGYDVYFYRRLVGASFSPGMLVQLPGLVRWADIVHLTSVYSPPTLPTLWLARLHRKPVVWSPRGALQRWEGSQRLGLKALWESICNASIIRGACTFHVTVEKEAEESKARIPNAEISMIPNGVTISPEYRNKTWRPEDRLRLLFIGRLHPIKGLENLFQCLLELPQNVLLTVCGAGESSYETKLNSLVQKLGITERVHFQGHVIGEDKRREFERADVCVVPSFTENFGMVVVEALAHGVPVIAGRATPWEGLEKKGCGYWIENTPDSLADAIRRIERQDLATMGGKGRQWMMEEYGWDRVAQQMLGLYQDMVDRTTMKTGSPATS